MCSVFTVLLSASVYILTCAPIVPCVVSIPHLTHVTPCHCQHRHLGPRRLWKRGLSLGAGFGGCLPATELRSNSPGSAFHFLFLICLFTEQERWRKPRSVLTLVKQSKRTEKVERKIIQKIHSIETELQESDLPGSKLNHSLDFLWPSSKSYIFI